jgi:hypothetical protein
MKRIDKIINIFHKVIFMFIDILISTIMGLGMFTFYFMAKLYNLNNYPIYFMLIISLIASATTMVILGYHKND